MAKRSKSPQFRVTPEEDAHLRQAAKDAEMGLSDYLRAVTLHPTVVVVSETKVVLIPSTVTLADADEALRTRFRDILSALRESPPDQEPTPAASAAAPPPTAQPPADVPAAPAPAAPPASAPVEQPPSPGTADAGMVGTSSPATASGSPSQDRAGAGPEEQPVQAAVSQVARCVHCGGTDGRHQSFCETVRGEPPVATEALEPDGMEAYVAARIQEGELRVVAEAEWRQRQASPDPNAPAAVALPEAAVEAAKAPCPSCGAMKLPAAQCLECGRRPG